jgi:hypothetical protein
MTPPHSVTEDNRPFIRSHWRGYIENKLHSFVIMASQFCLSLLLSNEITLLDGTFRSVPSGFYQVIKSIKTTLHYTLLVTCNNDSGCSKWVVYSCCLHFVFRKVRNSVSKDYIRTEMLT